MSGVKAHNLSSFVENGGKIVESVPINELHGSPDQMSISGSSLYLMTRPRSFIFLMPL